MQQILHPIIGPAGPEKADLTGKTALVTGGAEGIGEEVGRFFALMGAKVILTNRKKEQGDEAIKYITEECKKEGKTAQVEWVGCDLGNLNQVKEVFTGLRDKLDRLDLVRLQILIQSSLHDEPR
jgi:NAD(P)-dependent dehydrogenase (short-subunit alcohol dehydrogenase family)